MDANQEFINIFSQAGYALEDYQIDLQILSEHNQVIIVHDIPNRRWMQHPVEENILDMPMGDRAWLIVNMLNEANEKDDRHDPFDTLDLGV